MPVLEAEAVKHNLVEKCRSLIKGEDAGALEGLLEELSPADLADLIEHLDPDERLFVFNMLEPKGAGKVLVEIEPPVQEDILESLDDEAISGIVQELDSDDAADIVGDLPSERARQIISTLEGDVSEGLKRLLPFPDDSAGGIMGLEFVAVKADSTIQDAIEAIREKREEVENLYHIWVVDELDRLVGLVSMKDLVLAPPQDKISVIMNPDVISVHVYTDQEEVAHLVKKYNLVAIPVVDNHNRLVGRITHDDIIEVIEQETDEDISLMAGVIDQNVMEHSPLRISRSRLPWLVGGLIGGIIAAGVISQFEPSLKKIVALSFFFPVIMAVGGNTGTQAATVIVRGLATGDIGLITIGKQVWLEMRVALVNGLICGALLGLVVGVWLSSYKLGSIVAVSTVLVIIGSGLIGSVVPLTLKKLNLDPALGTGPFVTSSNDILSLFIYLGLVTLFLSLSA